jgi:hypothetical protein
MKNKNTITSDPLFEFIDAKKAKEISEDSKLSYSIIYKIIIEFLLRAKKYNDEDWIIFFANWLRNEETNNISNWLLSNYCKLHIDNFVYPEYQDSCKRINTNKPNTHDPFIKGC